MDSTNNGNIDNTIECNYNSSNSLSFISTPYIGKYFPENSYEAQWCDHHVNVHVHFIFSPHIISSLLIV